MLHKVQHSVRTVLHVQGATVPGERDSKEVPHSCNPNRPPHATLCTGRVCRYDPYHHKFEIRPCSH